MGQKERAEACQLSSDLYPLIIPAQEINKCERECTHRRYHSNPLRHHYKQWPGTFFFLPSRKQAKKPISGSGSPFHFATMVTFIYIYPKTVRKIKTQTIQKSTQQISIRTCLRQCRGIDSLVLSNKCRWLSETHIVNRHKVQEKKMISH